jgi:hypothetical protein
VGRRVNSYSNVSYAADPVIFSWELLQNPRCGHACLPSARRLCASVLHNRCMQPPLQLDLTAPCLPAHLHACPPACLQVPRVPGSLQRRRGHCLGCRNGILSQVPGPKPPGVGGAARLVRAHGLAGLDLSHAALRLSSWSVHQAACTSVEPHLTNCLPAHLPTVCVT